ncbi:hypothetical protein MPSEU_000618600 [Mayamaea pseudoterrestris]|nr:hypothetical protein MPSEU_000618600 [Mayamaea pseudoterrestris]
MSVHSSSNNNHRNSAVSSWSDWMAESCVSIDLFGCDVGQCANPGNVLNAALRLQTPPVASACVNTNARQDCSNTDVDYEQLHDKFLESLLAEQSKLSRNRSDDDGNDGMQIHRTNSELTASTVATMSTVATAATSTIHPHQQAPDPPGAAVTVEPDSPRKRRRPLGLSRSNRNNSNISATSSNTATNKRDATAAAGIRVAPRRQVSITSTRSECSTRSVVSLGALADAQAADPSLYLHAHCRMQKDKGKGDEVGANICAKGRDACLEKLRAKMHLLTDVVLDDRKGPATMKRRKARIHQDLDNFCETRSLIELRMGFLSMTYGVLLRWDKSKTDQVTLVVLRKLCHESFYPKAPRREPAWTPTYNATAAAVTPPKLAQGSSLLRDVIGNRHAILQRQDGTEVELLEPPYRVPRPLTFEPSVLTVTALYATGLSKKSNWTVKLSYEGQSESILLSWDEEQRCFTPKLGQALMYCAGTTDLQPTSLDLTLYEHRLRRRSYRRHILTTKVSLLNIEAQPSSSRRMTRLTVPCKHDADATISVGVLLKSDHVVWLRQELDMRRKEETATGLSFLPWRRFSVVEEEQDQENRDPWDWIYSICVC